MHANLLICAAWEIERITEIINLEIDVQICWVCWICDDVLSGSRELLL